MKTPHLAEGGRRWFGATGILVGVALLWVSASADVPGRPGGAEVTGMYQVVASNDPLFPERENVDWFLDFGEGVRSGNTSGTVAVSMRENPHVKVRLLVWQLFGGSALKIGAPTHEGSRQAVTIADWEINGSAGGLVLRRDSYEVRLSRAEP